MISNPFLEIVNGFSSSSTSLNSSIIYLFPQEKERFLILINEINDFLDGYPLIYSISESLNKSFLTDKFSELVEV